MDDCAAALGADPLTFRLRNLLRDGDLSVTGSRMYDVTARECALAAAAAVGWHPNEADLRDDRRPARAASAPSRRYGVGISVGISGTGVLGGGDPASAEVSIEVDGTVVVRFGSPEDGAGEKTTMALIAAEALAVDPDHVAVVATDTDATPWTAGTFGNRVTFIDGNAVMRAAQDARRQALAVAGRQLGLAPEELSWLPHGNVSAPDGRAMTLAEIGATAVFVQAAPITGRGTFETGAAPMEPDRGQGHATGAYLFAASAVELEVDVETGELDLLNVVLCHDVGRAVNPLFVEGQFDGGISWSIGAAMLEDLMPRYPALDFQPRNFDTYKLPTVLDMPPRENIVLEIPSSDGPFGAKALGEYTANLSHAAIGNALRHATGVRVGRLPLTPERVLRALDEAGPVRRGA
jgi:CO/xanthine dehydrogenase Mo-binding subunit